MEVGDTVQLSATTLFIQQVWIIKALRTDAKGVWLQFQETPPDTWHNAAHYEVINK